MIVAPHEYFQNETQTTDQVAIESITAIKELTLHRATNTGIHRL